MALFENLTSEVVQFIIGILDLFPDDPFLAVQEFYIPASVAMSYVNWFIDFPSIINITFAWVSAIFVWYAYSIILRWVKLAG